MENKLYRLKIRKITFSPGADRRFFVYQHLGEASIYTEANSNNKLYPLETQVEITLDPSYPI